MTTQRAWAHAGLGVVIIAVSIAGGALLGSRVAATVGATGLVERLIPATLVCALALGLVVLAVRRRPDLSLAAIGLTRGRAAWRALALGACVPLGAAALVLGVGSAAGLVTVDRVDLAVLGGFLLTNTLAVVLLEALPEEVALRGYTLTALLSRHGRGVAVLAGAAWFVGAGLLTGLLLGLPDLVTTGALRLVPEGEDAVVYVVFLLLFGVMLGYARLATASRAIWTGVAAHVSVLTVNRLLLLEANTTGVWLELSPDGILLLPAFVVLTLAVLVWLARRTARTPPPIRDDAAVSERTSVPVDR